MLPDVLSREMEENVQNVRAIEPVHPVRTIRMCKGKTRERTIERADEPPTQRPRLENPARSTRWSRVDDPRHWGPATAVEDEEDMWTEMYPEVLWQQQVDDHIWENNGKPACLCQEEWDELFSSTCENVTAHACCCRSEFTGLTATRMTRGDVFTLTHDTRIGVATFSSGRGGRVGSHLGHFRCHDHLSGCSKKNTQAFVQPESFLREMFIVRSPVKVLEQRDKPSVGGVFLVIVIQTYHSLNNLLQHHKHLQFTHSCWLQRSSNAK